MALYLNNAATTWPKPDCVPEAMAAFLRTGGANLARGSAASRDLSTLDLVTTCRERVSSLLGGHAGGDPRYVTFTANVTEALNVVLKGLLRPGMRVLTSSMEHNAVIRPLRGLEAAGVRVEVLPCSSEGFLDPGTLRDALKEPADLMVLSHGSNVCGALQDLDALASLCDGAGVPLVLDAAQTAGVLPLDATRWNLGALCFTGHKGLLGPQGVGGILWRPDLAERCAPFVEGGTGSFSHEETQPEALPDKFEAGTPNLPGIAGLAAALEWLETTGIETVAERERRLGTRLLEGLRTLPGIALLGPRSQTNRLPVFALNLEGWDNGTLALELSDRYGIESRPGLHCAPLAHRTLGSFPQGALRLSPGFFNTPEEMDRTVRALGELAQEAR